MYDFSTSSSSSQSGSSFSSDSSPEPYIKKHWTYSTPTRDKGHYGRHDQSSRHRSYSPYVNSSHLRKSFKHTCENIGQMLLFYEQSIVTLEEHGIHLKDLRNIHRNGSIFSDPSLLKNIKKKHSKYIFQVLNNEDIFPKSFTQAWGIISEKTNICDGAAKAQPKK